jgi:hypothetical protein
MYQHVIAVIATIYGLIVVGIDSWFNSRAYRLRDKYFKFRMDGIGILSYHYFTDAMKALVVLFFLFPFLDSGKLTSTMDTLMAATLGFFVLATFTRSAVRSLQDFFLWRKKCEDREATTSVE